MTSNSLLHELFFAAMAVYPQDDKGLALSAEEVSVKRSQIFIRMRILLAKGLLAEEELTRGRLVKEELVKDELAKEELAKEELPEEELATNNVINLLKLEELLHPKNCDEKEAYAHKCQTDKRQAALESNKNALAIITLRQIVINHFYSINENKERENKRYYLSRDTVLYQLLASPPLAIDINALPDAEEQQSILSLLLTFKGLYAELDEIIADIILTYPEAYCFAEFSNDVDRDIYLTSIATAWQETELSEALTFYELALLNHDVNLMYFLSKMPGFAYEKNRNINLFIAWRHFAAAFKAQDMPLMNEIYYYRNFDRTHSRCEGISLINNTYFMRYLINIFSLLNQKTLNNWEKWIYRQLGLQEFETLHSISKSLTSNIPLEKRLYKFQTQLKLLRKIIYYEGSNPYRQCKEFVQILHQIEKDNNLFLLENLYETGYYKTEDYYHNILSESIKLNKTWAAVVLLDKKVGYSGDRECHLEYRDRRILSILQIAIDSKADLKIISLLLENNNVDPNIWSATLPLLFHVIKSKRDDLGKAFLENKRVNIDIRHPTTGQSAIEFATAIGCSQTIADLLQSRQQLDCARKIKREPLASKPSPPITFKAENLAIIALDIDEKLSLLDINSAVSDQKESNSSNRPNQFNHFNQPNQFNHFNQPNQFNQSKSEDNSYVAKELEKKKEKKQSSNWLS